MRQLIGRAVVRLYPAEIQQARAAELLGTLMDASDSSTVDFVSNAFSIALFGLVARARTELGRPLGELVLTALAWAAVIDAMSELVQGVGTGLFWGYSIFSYGTDPETILRADVLPVLILASFTIGRSRAAGLLGLARLAIGLHQLTVWEWADIQYYIVPLLGFGILTLAPRRVRSAGRCLWPMPAAFWAFYWLTLLGQHSGIGKLTTVLAAFLLLPIAPALALGVGIDWAVMGLRYVTSGGGDAFPLWTAELLSCLPIALLLIGAGRRTARSARTAK